MHSLTIDAGWREVAEKALEFAREHTSRIDGRIALCSSLAKQRRHAPGARGRVEQDFLENCPSVVVSDIGIGAVFQQDLHRVFGTPTSGCR